eukprot:gnl/TRDRNA2_/TRDRNA2_134809_c0_seq1.p1 gnl/TRDRNA2_/TRDRNA2_134809_c0~~gnl/TRDRNA2_/TRDRNA2_134809_c0_seq1.p1  ORF type:complete len:467 (+),score=77.95 gnl/TRDRNA2_/TRDRNA2_134809_c0_seq1:91-1491(+)
MIMQAFVLFLMVAPVSVEGARESMIEEAQISLDLEANETMHPNLVDKASHSAQEAFRSSDDPEISSLTCAFAKGLDANRLLHIITDLDGDRLKMDSTKRICASDELMDVDPGKWETADTKLAAKALLDPELEVRVKAAWNLDTRLQALQAHHAEKVATAEKAWVLKEGRVKELQEQQRRALSHFEQTILEVLASSVRSVFTRQYRHLGDDLHKRQRGTMEAVKFLRQIDVHLTGDQAVHGITRTVKTAVGSSVLLAKKGKDVGFVPFERMCGDWTYDDTFKGLYDEELCAFVLADLSSVADESIDGAATAAQQIDSLLASPDPAVRQKANAVFQKIAVSDATKRAHHETINDLVHLLSLKEYQTQDHRSRLVQAIYTILANMRPSMSAKGTGRGHTNPFVPFRKQAARYSDPNRYKPFGSDKAKWLLKYLRDMDSRLKWSREPPIAGSGELQELVRSKWSDINNNY